AEGSSNELPIIPLDADQSIHSSTVVSDTLRNLYQERVSPPEHSSKIPYEAAPLLKTPNHFSDVDEIIRVICEREKISHDRKNALREVMSRLVKAFEANEFFHGMKFRLDVYGSSCNGFASNRSDFDISFRYIEEFNGWERMLEKHSNIHIATINAIERSLKSVSGIALVESITSARVPIVKFASRVDRIKIDGDISCYNELALHNSQLLRRYCAWTKDEMLSKLGLFVKRWAKECDICDASKGSLSSYAYMILLIHFLQRLKPHPLLPMLQEV
ncbi:hypothetical protein PMAYCL1PPCAC_27825, partial [Pristionchus mayeri]